MISALVGKSFSRTNYLKSLDSFYVAIENAARTLPDFADKQHFLNTVYERFFQGYSTKLADTHGIVYTPQPIVDFMCASVVHVLKAHFAKLLGAPNVNVLDPCTGTGNFVVNILRRVSKRNLAEFYKEQLFANEIILVVEADGSWPTQITRTEAPAVMVAGAQIRGVAPRAARQAKWRSNPIHQPNRLPGHV